MAVELLEDPEPTDIEHGPIYAEILYGINQKASLDCMDHGAHCRGMYFTASCSAQGRPVLLGDGNLIDVTSGPFGLELHYRCHCGEEGVLYPQLARIHDGCPAPA